MFRIGLLGVTLVALLVSVDAACEDDQVAHCSSCSNPGVECIKCPRGWLINVDKTACDICPENCDECERSASGALMCVDCSYRYALRDVDTACLQCVDGCDKCHHVAGDVTDCDECYDRWVSVETGDVNTCLQCPSNCAACSQASDGTAACSQCIDYYFLKMADKTCKRCPTNCITCNDDGNGKGSCTKCKDNYNVNDADPTKSCLSCPSSCSSCTNTARSGNIAECDDCEKPFALDNKECISCDQNCMDCESTSSCLVCDDGYRVDIGSCSSCSSHCKECSKDDSTEVCGVCDDGYVPKDEKSCDECGSRCNVCDLNGRCTTCETFYEVDNKGNCQKCPSKCLDCTYNTGSGRTKCRSGWCETGYVVDNNGDCASCPDGCNDNACSWSNGLDETVCSACNSTVQPRTLNDDNTRCYDCPSDCASCSYNATGTGRVVCDICDSYFEVKDEQCDACPPACDACTFNDTISAMDCDAPVNCDSGYRWGPEEGIDENDICVGCGVANCDTCDTADLCTLCISPYQLRSDGTACEACPQNCNQCSLNGAESATECDNDNFCDSGYGLDASKECPSCRSHCKKCPMNNAGENPCKSGQCDAGYIDDSSSGDCKSCPSKCWSCTYSSADSRTKCRSGECYNRYALITTSGGSEGNCASCPENCAECDWSDDGEGNTGTVCTSCDALYDLRTSDGTCVPCPDYCYECTYSEDLDDTECDSNQRCHPCFGITPEGKCDACPYYCEDCDYDEDKGFLQCTQCKSHYVLNDGVCGACPAHCTTCGHNSGDIDCTLCDDKYALYQGECVSCPSNCHECTINTNGVAECKEKQCKDGYGRNSKKTCSACSSFFENCNLCSDTTGFNADGGEVADCYSCFGAYTLADDSSVCKDTFAGTCSKFEDRNYVCSSGSCDQDYEEMRNGSCSTQCYSCGSTRNNELMDFDTCQTNWAANTSATELCLNDCWVVTETTKVAGFEVAFVARGCHVPDSDLESKDSFSCKNHKSRKCRDVTVNGVKTERCLQCCFGKLCNDQDGGSAIKACFALLLASAIFAVLH